MTFKTIIAAIVLYSKVTKTKNLCRRLESAKQNLNLIFVYENN